MTIKNQLAAEEKLSQRFNIAAYRFGILFSADLLCEKKEDELFSDASAIDRVLDAKNALHFSPDAANDKLSAGLELPLIKLKAGFVKKIDAVVRKLDPQKVDARTMAMLRKG